jgi:cobalt-zinc-cadmium efflux system outer membrane protein
MYQINLISVFLIYCLVVHVMPVQAQDSDDQYLNIEGLINEALDSNPGVQSAQAALEAASARVRADSQALYNPELELEAENVIDQSGSIGISQSIDWSNKRSIRSDAASYERQAVAARLHKVRQELAIELLNGLIQYDVAQKQAELVSEREQLMRQFANLAEQRRRAGDLNQVELDLALLAYAQAQLQNSQIELSLIEARQSLDSVLGDRIVPTFSLPDTPPDLNIQSSDIDQLLNKLPAIQVQVARLAAAAKRVKLRTLEKRPDPTVGMRVGQEESSFIAGLSVSIPLYLRNDFGAEVDEANAQRMEIELEAQDIYRRARADMAANLERFNLVRDAWDNWLTTGRQSLGSQVNVLERLWRAGEIGTTDYLVQVNQSLDTRAEAEALRGQLWHTWADWIAASGQVDEWLGQKETP